MHKILLFVIFSCISHYNSIGASESTLQTTHIVDCVNEIDNLIENALKSFNVPGASVGLVIDDQLVFSRGYGYRNVAEELPVTEHTVFPIASCTKAFTAFILGQLVDEGLVEWDDPVKKYIPELELQDSYTADQLSIRDLLAHRSGIGRNDALWFSSGILRSDLVDYVKHLHFVFPLRAGFHYNNLIFALAGTIIEKVTGQTWEEVVASRIFSPLTMNHSSATLEELLDAEEFSLPYAQIGLEVERVPFRDPFPVSPGAAINSNIIDLAKWVQLHLSRGVFLDKALIQEKILQEMYKVQIPFPLLSNAPVEIEQLGYGLGWLVSKFRGLDCIYHSGNVDGFSSDIAFLPKEKIGLVILTNSGNNGRIFINCLRYQIFDWLLGNKDGNWVNSCQKLHDYAHFELQNALDAFEALKKAENISDGLEQYVGSYDHPAYGVLEVTLKDGSLKADLGEMSTQLTFYSEDLFMGANEILLYYGINPITDFSFYKNSSGEICELHVAFEKFHGDRPVVFKKL